MKKNQKQNTNMKVYINTTEDWDSIKEAVVIGNLSLRDS
jgi:hypothetical protein